MKTILTLLLVLTGADICAQINAYAKVTAINSTNITVSLQNENYAVFSAGMQIIVMQMQDDVIGLNTGDNADFGNLATLSSAGVYEIANVSSVVRSGGVITQININSPLAKTFNTGPNSSVQVTSYPQLGTTSYTTASDIIALPWNGNYGGVVAFSVNGVLTLNHCVTADGAGFRGAAANGGSLIGSCGSTPYRAASGELLGDKGEGIYKSTNPLFAAGRGKILTGGGGGNSINAGGGGGSNLKGGGKGGKGYSCSIDAGGLGGIALESYISGERVFMGGGGGAGESNDNFNTRGANGAGIIIITAEEITTTGTGSACITANGNTAPNVGNDGAGGGGAAGSIVLNIKKWSVSPTRPLRITANGGDGSNVNHSALHGGGGGGSQGAVFFHTPVPQANITTNTLSGKGGRNAINGSTAENAQGVDNSGFFAQALLPVQLLTFKGTKRNAVVELSWMTTNEKNIQRYEVQRGNGDGNFGTIGTINVAGNTGGTRQHSFTDLHPFKTTGYYRLGIFDLDGTLKISSVVVIKPEEKPELQITLFPNPAHNQAKVKIWSWSVQRTELSILDMAGNIVKRQSAFLTKGENTLTIYGLGRLTEGNYEIFLRADGRLNHLRLTIRK